MSKIIINRTIAKSIIENHYNNKLRYYKDKLLEILNRQERIENKNISKSMNLYLDMIEKSRGKKENVGHTVVRPDGTKWRKISEHPSKWVRIYESETRGAKQAARILKSKIENAQSLEELANIVKMNIRRFSDSNGQILPIAKELLQTVNEKQKLYRTVNNAKTLKNNDIELDIDCIPEGIRNDINIQEFYKDLNNSSPANPEALKLYQNLDFLLKFRNKISKRSVKYTFSRKKNKTKTDSCFGVEYSNLSVTLPDYDNSNERKVTYSHEFAHSIDFLLVNATKGDFIESSKDFTRAVIKNSPLKIIPENCLDFLKKNDYIKSDKFNDIKEKLKNQLEKEKAYHADLTDESYKEYYKAYNEYRNVLLDYYKQDFSQSSPIMDILDALSGGKLVDNFRKFLKTGKIPKNDFLLPWGHGAGKKNFGDIDNCKSEIFADYMALNITNPEGVAALKKDFPDLVKSLDDIVNEMNVNIEALKKANV